MNKIGCPICKHFQFDGTCSAFPGRDIPLVFVAGMRNHKEPVPDQENDLVFEWISPEKQGKRRAEAIAKRCLEQVACHRQVAVLKELNSNNVL